MKYNITVIEGDGIGPEVVKQGIKVLNAIGSSSETIFNYSYEKMGGVSIEEHGVPLTDETIDRCLESDAILFGAIGDPKYDNNPDLKVRPEQGLLKLRKELGLFANIRPVAAYPHLYEQSPLKVDRIEAVDLLIYRELTSGIYFGDKGYKEEGTVAYDVCEYSVNDIIRILKLAFEAAAKRNNKLTLVDKANVMESSRLWRKCANEIHEQYPEVELDYLFVDNAAMQMILNPKQFDVIVTSNMFGDILSDEASVIAGSLGLLPSASIGSRSALFEPIHGSFPQAKGENIANPVGTILSVAMLLDHLGLNSYGDIVRRAVNKSFEDGIESKDLNPDNYLGTEAIGDYIAQYVKDIMQEPELVAWGAL